MVDTASMDESGGWIPPMKAGIGDLPTGEGWAYELKWDGMRIQSLCRPHSDGQKPELVLRSLSGREVTSTFPELDELPSSLGASAVFDGEVVVFDGGRPSFHELQHRIHVERPTQTHVSRHPIVYLVFDLLELDGRSLLDLPYSSRRSVLEDFLEDGPSWRVPPIVLDDGAALFALAKERKLEGIVAKRLSSRYVPGTRSGDWVKVKVDHHQEFVVVGWLPGQGRLEGQVGSLLVAVMDEGRLRFAGAVGSGLGDRDRDQLAPLLVTSPDCPFDEVPALDKTPTWIDPKLVVEIRYGSWPADGLLRHPVYLGLRTDDDPDDVVREMPP